MKGSLLPQFVIVVISLTCTVDGYLCDNGWIAGYHKSCYKFVTNQKLGWAQAQGACRDMGGHLATLEDAEEIIWMKGYRFHHPELWDDAWVGGFKNDGKWFWKGDIADSSMIVPDWGGDEPNNSGGRQDCVALFGGKSDAAKYAKSKWFKFDDRSCDTDLGYICEMSYK